MSIEIISVASFPIEFSCLVLNDSRLYPNVYSIRLGIDPIENNTDNIGIGFQRIRYFNENLLENSILLPDKTDLIKNLDKLDNNFVCLPCDIYDIYFGSVLMAKFQSITKNYFEIEYLSISSALGESIEYSIIDPYDMNLDIGIDHWWNQDNVWTGSKKPITWDELNLIEIPKFKPTVIKGGLSEN